MSWTDHGRRGVALLVAVLCLLLAPQLAAATFGGRQSATAEVSTAAMVAPANVSGSYRCQWWLFREGLDLTVAGFEDRGPAGARYTYTLTMRSGADVDTVTTSSRSARLRVSGGIDVRETGYTLTVQAVLGSWTSPPSTTEIACPPGWGGGEFTTP